MEEKENKFDNLKRNFSELFIERSYSVKEFFYDDSFKDYIVKRFTIKPQPTNFDFASLYPYHHAPIEIDTRPVIIDHLSMIQSIGRIKRSSNTENTVLRVEKNRYYDRDEAIRIQNHAVETMRKITEMMKEYKVSYLITAEQESKS